MLVQLQDQQAKVYTQQVTQPTRFAMEFCNRFSTLKFQLPKTMAKSTFEIWTAAVKLSVKLSFQSHDLCSD
jgi:hypothetical protein